MRIGVEATVLTRAKKTGVDYFTRGLVQAVSSAMPEDQFDLGYFGKPGVDLGVHNPNINLRPIMLPRKIYQGFYRYLKGLPYDVLTRTQDDVFFFPDFVALPLANPRTKRVVLVHDLSYIDTPQYFTDRARDYLVRFVPKAVHSCDHIIANSAFTKKRIMEEYGIADKKISIIFPAIDHRRFKPAEKTAVTAVKAKYGIEGDYILFVGTLTDRKNVTGLMKAYAALQPDLREKTTLVLAGGDVWTNLKDAAIEQLLAKLSTSNRIVRTGYFEEDELPALYSGASVFVYPSFYEGFGMPVVEAMACGTPVITSDTSSLPEAGGKAALYVNPKQPEMITEALRMILTDTTLARALRAKGIEQAGNFTWETAGKQLKQVFEALR